MQIEVWNQAGQGPVTHFILLIRLKSLSSCTKSSRCRSFSSYLAAPVNIILERAEEMDEMRIGGGGDEIGRNGELQFGAGGWGKQVKLLEG